MMEEDQEIDIFKISFLLFFALLCFDDDDMIDVSSVVKVND